MPIYLPPELLPLCFTHLVSPPESNFEPDAVWHLTSGARSALYAASLVCTSWRAVTIPLIWEKFNISAYTPKEGAALANLATLLTNERERFSRLTLPGTPPTDATFAMDYARYIRHLRVHIQPLCNHSVARCPSLASIITTICNLLTPTQLVSLRVKHQHECVCPSDPFLACYRSFVSLTSNLVEFEINATSSCPKTELTDIIRSLSPTLRSLRMRVLSAATPSPPFPFPNLHDTPELHFPRPCFLAGLQAWGAALRTLHLIQCQTLLTDFTIRAIANTCTRLETLSLAGVSSLPFPTDASLCRLVDTCGRTTLRHLSLRSCPSITTIFYGYCAARATALRSLRIIGESGFTGAGVFVFSGWALRLRILIVGRELDPKFLERVHRTCPELVVKVIAT